MMWSGSVASSAFPPTRSAADTAAGLVAQARGGQARSAALSLNEVTMARPSGRLDSRLRPNNRSGATGIYFRERTQRFIAQLQLHRTRYHIGCFDTLSEAVTARRKAEEQLQAQ
jgi:hypothetical protein